MLTNTNLADREGLPRGKEVDATSPVSTTIHSGIATTRQLRAAWPAGGVCVSSEQASRVLFQLTNREDFEIGGPTGHNRDDDDGRIFLPSPRPGSLARQGSSSNTHRHPKS